MLARVSCYAAMTPFNIPTGLVYSTAGALVSGYRARLPRTDRREIRVASTVQQLSGHPRGAIVLNRGSAILEIKSLRCAREPPRFPVTS